MPIRTRQRNQTQPNLLYNTSEGLKWGLSVLFSTYEGKKQHWNWSVDTVWTFFQEGKRGKEKWPIWKKWLESEKRKNERERDAPPIPLAACSSSAVWNVLAYHRSNRRMHSFRLGCVASETTLVRHIPSFWDHPPQCYFSKHFLKRAPQDLMHSAE